MRLRHFKTILISGAVITCALSAMGLAHSVRSESTETSTKELSNIQHIMRHHDKPTCGKTGIGISNPADNYCIEMGYELKSVRDNDGGQHAVCIFPDNTRCDTWAFLEGRCGREFSVCAQEGLDMVISTRIKNAYSKYTAMCVDENSVGGSVPKIMGLENLGNPLETEELEALKRVRSSAGGGSVQAIGPLPSAFDWRDEAGEDWTTPPKNQSQCGSCWAFSAVGAIEGAMNVAANDPNLDRDLSEEYLVSDCASSQGDCCGGWSDSALQFVLAEGIPDEGCLPYDVAAYATSTAATNYLALCSCDNGICNSSCPGKLNGGSECANSTCDQACSNMDNRLFQIDGVTAVANDAAAIKNALIENGPLSVSLLMNGIFDTNDIYRCTSTTCWDKNRNNSCDSTYRCDTTAGRCVSNNGSIGNNCNYDSDCREDSNNDGICNQDDCGVDHAVLLVGYDDNSGHWIAKNSWGNTWNGNGFFNIAYGECHIEDYVVAVELDDQQTGVLIPGRIEAEDYNRSNDSTQGNQGGDCDTGDNVDKEITADSAGGGCNIGWTTAGEWLEYDVYVETDDTFSITARLASDYTERGIHFNVDNTDVTGFMAAPANGWQNYEDVTAEGIFMNAGHHVIQLYLDTDYVNINYLDIAVDNNNPDPHPEPTGCTCPRGCDNLAQVWAPFTIFGKENRCFFFEDDRAGSAINSWNVQEVTLNGIDITGRWIERIDYPAAIDGGYYIYVRGDFDWSHAEVLE